MTAATGWGVVPPDHAITTLVGAFLGDGAGCQHIHWYLDGGRVEHIFDADDGRRMRAFLGWLGERREVQWLAVPRARREVRYAGLSSALWCRVETRQAWERLQRFRPEPTIVLREGSSSRADAIWALDRCLTLDWTVRGCERLSYNLGGVRKHANPDEYLLHPPGSCLRDGRTRPIPVVTAACTDAIYHPKQVVGRLKDAPARDAWRERSAA